jgi:hypothetical protein
LRVFDQYVFPVVPEVPLAWQVPQPALAVKSEKDSVRTLRRAPSVQEKLLVEYIEY